MAFSSVYQTFPNIEDTLTIEPGAIIKSDSFYGAITVYGNGKIIAVGTADKPIIFTSIYDDLHGGGSNGDGNFTSAMNYRWNGIGIDNSNSSSQFEYCHFFYGGGSSDAAIGVIHGVITVRHCTFAYNGRTNAPRITSCIMSLTAKEGTEITDNIFYGNGLPIFLDANLSLDDSNIFHNPANPAEKNTPNTILVAGGGGWASAIGKNVSWTEQEVPFVIDYPGQIDISITGSLTLGENVIIKVFESQSAIIIHNNNIFNYDASGVHFTAYSDDTYGGDSNGNGPSQGSPGSWAGIRNDAKYIQPNYYYEPWTNIHWAAKNKGLDLTKKLF